MKARAAVILIVRNKIALIERHRAGRHYFVFPGGKVEPGESPAQAAAREVEEELGIIVKIGRMVAEVSYLGAPQYYFLAEEAGGQFGSGTGHELGSKPDSEKGSYQPVWMDLPGILDIPLLPRSMANYVWKSYPASWPERPWVTIDHSPDELVKP